MQGSFLNKFANQRLLRRAFFEEFKISSTDYILLLFESVIRLLAVTNQDSNSGLDAKVDGRRFRPQKDPNSNYNKKNYRRFLDDRAERI